MDSEDKLHSDLKSTFSRAINSTRRFDIDKFYEIWFGGWESTQTFVFKKNLSKTNMQFAELLALLRIHAKSGDGSVGGLHFLDKGSFDFGLNRNIKEFLNSKLNKEQISELCSKLYLDILRPLVVVEPLFGTCTVRIPKHLHINAEAICHDSGYIHSCGPCVFIENIDHARIDSLAESLIAHIGGTTKKNEKVMLAVYSHEDFTKYDRDDASYLKGGLDDLKIHYNKYYVSNVRLIRVLDELKSKLGNKICIPPPGNFRKVHKGTRDEAKALYDRTIWLFVDHGINRTRNTRSDDQFLLVVDQRFKNSNPTHALDENKPAWIAHTTMPPTLAGAMMNLSRPFWGNGVTKILDPFSGTAAIGLESLKFQEVQMNCCDIEPIANLMWQDNLGYFSMSKTGLIKAARNIGKLLKLHSNHHLLRPKSISANSKAEPLLEKYNQAVSLLDNYSDSSDTYSMMVTKEGVAELDKLDLEARTLFYLCVRAKLRHYVALERREEEWERAFAIEAQLMQKSLLRLSAKRESPDLRIDPSSGIGTFLGNYSKCVTIPRERFQQELNCEEGSVLWAIGDASISGDEKFDLIIGDPPYGFNTDTGSMDLAKLFTNFLYAALEQLNSPGQLILCLPEKSHSGRKIMPFTTSGWVTQQVLAIAQKLEMEAINIAEVLPGPSGNLFRAPYFWRSERALSRAIVHFRFQKKYLG